MDDYPQGTIAIGARGKKEARVLRSRGSDFIVYGYIDIETNRLLTKYSILLKEANGEVEHLLIVPSIGGKELVVKHTTEKKERAVFDEKTKAVIFF